jgi:hypothetical protein
VTQIRPLMIVAAATALLIWPSLPGHAAPEDEVRHEVTAVDSSGGFNLTGEKVRPGAAARPAGSGHGSQPAVEYRYVPACIANSPVDEHPTCESAITNCPEPESRMHWVYRRVPPDNEFRLVHEPPFVCIGPNDPVDPRAAVAAVIESEFQRVAVARGVAEINPNPRTLVNVATRFQTPTPERYDIPLTLLGQSVVITAQAEKWTWHTGDGVEVTTKKGTRGFVEHVYRKSGQFSPYVVITWSGTYSVNGQPMGAIPGTVTSQGEPGSIDVRQARTQLVDQ